MSRKYYPVFATLGAVVLLQVFLSLAGLGYLYTQLTMAAYYSLVIIGLCVFMGYAGQISLGHGAFFAIGGYTSGVLTTINLKAHSSNLIVYAITKFGLTSTAE